MQPTTKVKLLAQALHHKSTTASRQWIIQRYGKPALEGALRRGLVVRVLEGEYTHSERATETMIRASATSRWLGMRGVVGGPTAAHLMGVFEDPDCVHVVGRPRIHIRGPQWMKIRHRKPGRRTVMVRGFPVCCPEDAAIQSWEILGGGRGTQVVIDCVRKGLTTADAIADRSKQYPRLRGRVPLMKLLEDLQGGIDSFLELQAWRSVFAQGTLVDVVRHVRLSATGKDYVVDFFHSSTKIAIETDGKAFHGDDVARRKDLARDAALATIGVLTLRFTYEDIMFKPVWCRNVVKQAIEARNGVAA